MSGVAHFFMVVGGSNIHERLAHFFIDIYTDIVSNGYLDGTLIAIGLIFGTVGIVAAYWKYTRKDIHSA